MSNAQECEYLAPPPGYLLPSKTQVNKNIDEPKNEISGARNRWLAAAGMCIASRKSLLAEESSHLSNLSSADEPSGLRCHARLWGF
jgi:hypothetical protein